jgi:hypothetical protein
VANGTHVLLELRHNDPKQMKKVVRGNAQVALLHVGLHDAQDSSRLAPEKFGQVSAPEVAGHEKLEIQGTKVVCSVTQLNNAKVESVNDEDNHDNNRELQVPPKCCSKFFSQKTE